MKKKIIIELKFLIGEINYLICYKNLIQTIIDNCKHKKINSNICDIDKDIWKKNIHPNFFRPFIKEFFKKYKSTYDFYIFTSLKKEIAIDLIEIIEKYVNITFKKPIFTFEDLLVNSLNKYKKDIPFIPFMIIDDKDDWSENLNIITPEFYKYTFIPIIDSNLLFLIKNIKLKIKFNILPDENLTDNYNEYYFNYFLYTAQLHKSIQYINEENIKDDFFNKIFTIDKTNV
jgi:hypothetical protein